MNRVLSSNPLQVSHSFNSLPRRIAATIPRRPRAHHVCGRTAASLPVSLQCSRVRLHPPRVGDGLSADSDDEEAEEEAQTEEQLLQEYLQKVYTKRAESGSPSPVIRCLNCTQPAPFNGVCKSCGHVHANDNQLTYVPLEYSRSAFVHIRQQQLRQHQQANGTGAPQTTPSPTLNTATTQDTCSAATSSTETGLGPSSSAVREDLKFDGSYVAAAAPEDLKFDGSYVAAAAAAASSDSDGVNAPAAAHSNVVTGPASAPTNGATAPKSVNSTTTSFSSSLDGTTRTASSVSVSDTRPSSGGNGVHQMESVSRGPVLLAWDDRTNQHHNSTNKPGRDEATGLELRTHMHPERPQRTQAIVSRLYRSGLLDRCQALPARSITEEELLLVHTPELIHGVRDLSRAAAESSSPDHTLDVGGDTYANRHTWDVCTMAAGMAVEVALRVAKGEGAHGAAIVRPPGHHAERNGVMGFCFLNHGALAARVVQQAAGVERVAIVDWDVHHGNGAQHIMWDDPSVLTVSLHRYDNGNYFPGSGHVGEVGTGEGEGHAVNIPWSMPGMGDLEYLAAFDQVVIPVLKEYSPQLIIVAAGFDSAALDPLGGCSLTPVGFAQMTHRLKSVGPVVMLLEGGYNLTATASCFEACLEVLLGETPAPLPTTDAPAFVALRRLSEVLDVQSQYWTSLKPQSTSQLMECYHWMGACSILHQILQARQHATAQPPAAAMV